MARTRGAALKKGSAGPLCEISYHIQEHLHLSDIWGDRGERHILVKFEKTEGRKSRDWRARPALLKGRDLSKPVANRPIS